MKTLYSSTFLSVILGFLVLLDQNGQPIEIVETEERPLFSTIVEYQPANDPTEEVEISIYAAFTCERCRDYGLGTLRELRERYSDQDDMHVGIYITPNLEDEVDLFATKAIHCAAEQEKMTDMLQKIYELETPNIEGIKAKPAELKLNEEAFNSCLEDEETMEKINEDIARKEEEKITVIPSTTVNNKLFIGAHPVENMEREIRKQL